MPNSKGGRAAKPFAIELLVADHRKVDQLFKQYEDMKEDEDESRRAIAELVCAELTVHATVEEELFYPWLRENLDADDMEMVEEAEVEHQTAKDLIAQLEGAQELDAVYDAKVKVLSEYIKHHVKEEEEEIFPKVSDKKEELDELGQEMAARKVELMEELGVEDAPAPSEAKKSGAAGRPAAPGRGR
jgi:hemerythrin superfamily protein